MSIDDVIRQMQDDEAADRLETQTKATPIEYGRLRGIVPQKIYYHIRNGHIKVEECACGRKVIDIKAADAYFGIKQEQDEENGDEEGTEETDEE